MNRGGFIDPDKSIRLAHRRVTELAQRTGRDACDAVATAAENTASILRDRAASFEVIDSLTLVAIAQSYEQFAVELREISSGEGVVRSNPAKPDPINTEGK